MIIPPDPEKDPNLFLDLESADGRSLVDASGALANAAASGADGGLVYPERAHLALNGLGGYSYADDLGVGFTGEALPPYTSASGSGPGPSSRDSLERRAREGPVFADDPAAGSLSRRHHASGVPRSPPRVSPSHGANQSRPLGQAPPLPSRPHRHPYGQYSAAPSPPTDPAAAGPSSPTRTRMHTRHLSSPTTATRDRRSRRPPLPTSLSLSADPALSSRPPNIPPSPDSPSADAASDTLVDPSSSTHKLWESSSFPDSRASGKRRRLHPALGRASSRLSSLGSSIPTFVPEKYQKSWRRWRRWIYLVLLLVALAAGISIGVAVGLKAFSASRSPAGPGGASAAQTSWQDGTPGSNPGYSNPVGGDAKHSIQWAGGEDLNLTYVEGRDDPPPAMGNMTVCLQLGPVDPGLLKALAMLGVPYPGQMAAGATFRIPLNSSAVGSGAGSTLASVVVNGTNSTSTTTTTNTSVPTPYRIGGTGPSSSVALNSTAAVLSAMSNTSGLFILSNGLGSAGTLEWAGADAPVQILQGGEEGVIKVDLVMYYPAAWGNLSSALTPAPAPLSSATSSAAASTAAVSNASNSSDTSTPADGFDPSTVARVCGLSRTDGTQGIGIFTPIQTDGKISNPYMLNPAEVPGWHVLVRVPPSLFGVTAVPAPPSSASTTSSAPLSIPTFAAQLSRMALRFGQTASALSFGTWNVTSGRGGVTVGSVSAGSVGVWSAENAIKGRWAVSEGIMLNNTDSAVVAEVILVDPAAGAAQQVLEAPDLVRRDSDNDNDTSTSTTTTTIPAMFSTANSLLDVSFLAHPSSVALQAAVFNTGGDIRVSLHPAYVGAWAVRNYWGQVRVPGPGLEVPVVASGSGSRSGSTYSRRSGSSSGSTSLSVFDPWNQGRQRHVVFGSIDPAAPVNMTSAGPVAEAMGLGSGAGVLAQATTWDAAAGLGTGSGTGMGEGGLDAAVWVTGGAYWASGGGSSGGGGAGGAGGGGGEGEDGSVQGWTGDVYAQGEGGMTAREVQDSAEGSGSQVLVSGGWGDVVLTFDGT